MKKEQAPHVEPPVNEELLDDSEAITSLTDLIDEMDRTSFRRALASREHARTLEISSHDLRARGKT
jgi:hypothetical protein